MKYQLSKKLIGTTIAVLFSASAYAATESSTVAVTGILQDSNACTITAPASIDFGTVATETYHVRPVTIGINCVNGRAFSLTETTPTNIPMGNSLYAYLTTVHGNGTAINGNPFTGTGSGVVQNANLNLRLHGPSGTTSAIAAGAVGSFNVNVVYTLTF